MEKIRRNIKVSVLMWSLVLLLSAGGTLYYSDTTVKADTTVYITRTGSKYHTHKCGNGTYFESSLSEAKSMGLTACRKCFPGGSYSGSSSSSSSSTKKAVKPIKINKTSIVLVKGKSKKLKISNATQKVKWKSTKKSVATVSSKGKVTAKKKGKAVIIAKVGNQQKKCTVKVEAPKLNHRKVSMRVGETKKLKLSGCKHSIKWSTGDSDIVNVKKGKLKAKDVGTTKIKAKVHGKTFTCKVTVKKPTVTSVTLSDSNLTLDLYDSDIIYYRSKPANIYEYYDAIWKSGDENVIIVDDSYDEYADIYAVGVGETDIILIVGGKTVKCHVIVQ